VSRLVVKAEWTIRCVADRQVPAKDLSIVIDNGRIVDVTRDPPSTWPTIDVAGGIAFPGLINLHNHTINAPLFRGIVDDLPRKS
jgi:5-methylthioadenosine/S-adenosylhomocysteine deaminase